MNFEKSPFAIKDKDLKDFDKEKECSILAVLIKEQGDSSDIVDYWDKECEINPSNQGRLVYKINEFEKKFKTY